MSKVIENILYSVDDTHIDILLKRKKTQLFLIKSFSRSFMAKAISYKIRFEAGLIKGEENKFVEGKKKLIANLHSPKLKSLTKTKKKQSCALQKYVTVAFSFNSG